MRGKIWSLSQNLRKYEDKFSKFPQNSEKKSKTKEETDTLKEAETIEKATEAKDRNAEAFA